MPGVWNLAFLRFSYIKQAAPNKAWTLRCSLGRTQTLNKSINSTQIPFQKLLRHPPHISRHHRTLKDAARHQKTPINTRGNNVDLVLCVLLGHQNSKIANSMKLVNFALFSSQYHVFELKNIRGNLIAPNSNRWSLSNKIAMSQEDNRKIISLFGQEKSIFLHPWMLKDLM